MVKESENVVGSRASMMTRYESFARLSADKGSISDWFTLFENFSIKLKDFYSSRAATLLDDAIVEIDDAIVEALWYKIEYSIWAAISILQGDKFVGIRTLPAPVEKVYTATPEELMRQYGDIIPLKEELVHPNLYYTKSSQKEKIHAFKLEQANLKSIAGYTNPPASKNIKVDYSCKSKSSRRTIITVLKESEQLVRRALFHRHLRAEELADKSLQQLPTFSIERDGKLSLTFFPSEDMLAKEKGVVTAALSEYADTGGEELDYL